MTLVEPDSRLRLAFELRLDDDTLVESATDAEPLELTLGDGTLEAGLEALLEGLSAGDRVTFQVPPGQAFGPRDPGKIGRAHV